MQRLPNTPKGETESIGFRLPPPLIAMINREVDTLRASSPEGVSVNRSTALRALLVELEQRRAADPTSTPAPCTVRLARAATSSGRSAMGAPPLTPASRCHATTSTPSRAAHATTAARWASGPSSWRSVDTRR